MSWKLFGSAFALVFVAEFGDKTQLAAFAMASTAESKWTVFAAASLALIATTGIAVIAGGAVGRYVPAVWIKRVAGVLFIAMGLMFLLGRAPAAAPPPPGTDTGAPATSDGGGE